jgi:hypothetical protein
MSAMSRFALLILFVAVGCAPPPPARTFDPKPVEAVGLHNVFQIADGVYSGSSPEDERSFESLQLLQIKTILSVDGAAPDVEGAKSFGLRYVQLPIGYDGVSGSRAIEIAKAIRDLPGPIYIHCHHGKHRGPAAVAAALRCLEPKVSAESLAQFLKIAGTDPRYSGLYSAIEREPARLDDTKIAFPERTEPPDLVRRMVEIDAVWDRLNKKPTAKDATLLVEAYRELKRAVKERDERFQKYFDEAQLTADVLDASLRAGCDPSDDLNKSAAACSACHAILRDNTVKSPP